MFSHDARMPILLESLLQNLPIDELVLWSFASQYQAQVGDSEALTSTMSTRIGGTCGKSAAFRVAFAFAHFLCAAAALETDGGGMLLSDAAFALLGEPMLGLPLSRGDTGKLGEKSATLTGRRGTCVSGKWTAPRAAGGAGEC